MDRPAIIKSFEVVYRAESWFFVGLAVRGFGGRVLGMSSASVAGFADSVGAGVEAPPQAPPPPPRPALTGG
jgi:hypothetical protein